MTSRERFLAALKRAEVDHWPCCPIFWASPSVPGYAWRTDEERLEIGLARLGIDALLEFGIPIGFAPEVTATVWRESSDDGTERLHKRLDTPAGPLTCTVRLTADWPHGDDIPLMSDFVVSRIVEPWVETEADLDKLEHCWRPPEISGAELRSKMAPVRALADRWQVAIRSNVGLGLTSALSLFGAEQAAMAAIDRPELLARLAEIEHRTTLRRIELAAEVGVDFVTRNGFYETTDFWNPHQIERFLGDRLRTEIAACHAATLPVTYTICTGIMPILDYLAALPFDAWFGIEPVLTNQDMAQVAAKLGREHAIWGGVSSPFHLGQGTPETVRAAVREFVETFGRRGTILAPVPSIRPGWPWDNTLAMIDEWRRVRKG